MDMQGEDTLRLTLEAAQALNPALLEEPSADTLGGEPEIDFGNIEIRIGSRPIASDLGRLYTETGREIPREYNATFDGFRLWLIVFYVSISRAGWRKRLESLAMEIRYPDLPRVTITDLFPRPQFINHIQVDASAKAEAKASIDLSGRFQPAEELQAVASSALGLPATASAEGKLALSGKVGIVGQISCKIFSATVEAMGRGDYWSKWIFFRNDEKALLNDIELSQIVAAPKVVKKLRPNMRVDATASTFGLLPMTLRSPEVELDVKLPASAK
jgi:hypothetical protein